MGYTAEAAMDEKGLRDVERWKDKIEIRLDNRQVAFLFFGSALVACLLFILGVIVGKRIESRGRAVAPEIEDPLALLDRVASTERAAGDGATLPRALVGMNGKMKSAPAVTATSQKKAAPVQVAAAPIPTVPAEPAPAAAPKTPKAVSAPAIASAAVPVAEAPTAAKGKGRFSLQIRAFPDRAEADSFAKRFAGQSAYVVPAQVPGHGLWYRVRVGDYASLKDAIAAKATFEKQYSVIGLVVGPL